LWQAARAQYGIAKAGDLLWRLLHLKVNFGVDHEWLDQKLRLCPIHDQFFTIYHIRIECTIAEGIWREMIAFLGVSPAPDSVNELIAFMALPSEAMDSI